MHGGRVGNVIERGITPRATPGVIPWHLDEAGDGEARASAALYGEWCEPVIEEGSLVSVALFDGENGNFDEYARGLSAQVNAVHEASLHGARYYVSVHTDISVVEDLNNSGNRAEGPSTAEGRVLAGLPAHLKCHVLVYGWKFTRYDGMTLPRYTQALRSARLERLTYRGAGVVCIGDLVRANLPACT